MADFEQTNVRVPGTAKATLVRLARMLREDPAFLYRLNRFLEEETNPDTAALISHRVDRLERQVAELMAVHGSVAPLPSAPARPTSRPEAHQPWTTGTGRGRRLTPEGEAEMRRLIAEGKTDAQIAARLGVRAYSISRKRRGSSPTAT